MEPFPLFKLPYLAFKHVIVRMDFIKFALCSAKCYQIVKAMNLKVRYLTVEYSQCNQGLRIEFRKYFIYYWYFKNWETRHMKDCNELSRKNESIFPKKIASDPHGNNIDAVEHLAIFVSDLFRIEQIFYKLSADAFTNFREYFSDRIVNRKVVCDRVIIGACTFYEHLDGYYHMTNAGIHFVLDNLPDDIELSFSGRFPDDFEYKKLVTQRRISTDSCKLMISEQFLNSKFQQLTVRCGSRLTLEDYNSFMRKWSKHELEHDFQYIIMAIDYELYGEKWHENEEHLKTIFDGLNVKEYDHTRNLEDYPSTFDPDGHNIDGVEHLVHFVTGLFKIEHICYEMNADAFINFKEYFLDRIVNRKVVCDRVIINVWTDYEHLNRCYRLKNEGIPFILDNLPDDIESNFRGRFPEDFEYKKLVTQRRISTDSCKLMISEQFLNSKFQQLTVWDDSRFTLEDYNLFMRKWLKYELSEDFQYIFMAINYDLYGEKW